MMWHYYYGPMSFLGGIITIVWWVIIIWAIIYFIKWLRHDGKSPFHHRNNALEMLKERYAKGEIDKKEYEEKKKDLE